MGRDGLADVNRGEQIPFEHAADVFGFDVDGIVRIGFPARCRDVATSVVHENINWAEFAGDFRDDSLDVFGFCKVGEHTMRFHAVRLADGFRGVGQGGAFAVFTRTMLPHAMHTDLATHRCQLLCKRTPQPPPRTGNESRLTRQ